MDKLTLVNEIDTQLKQCTGMTRDGHYQVQQVLQHYREQVQLQQAKQERDNQQPPKTDGD